MKIALTTLCLLLGIAISPHVQAQSYLLGPTVSYQYQKGSILKTGVYYATSINTRNILKLDATANFTWIQNKHAVIPEVAATFYSDMYILGLFARTEFTPYTVTPKIGISALTVLELDFGYGFPMANKTNYRPIKGFTTSLRFNIPLNSSL
ncbi:hypothetical protein [Sphingobacterium paucimobilis]|uniref:Outer membrane protein beta-barrel domain-containing protein n=1 Tax=Sphingobacterium paucimobilis HER1398 TaxID=1346330 RepID=U2HTA0_9SPHI|nr:hypothetical protein [Sphingobacterium paucimobilis]ERJ58727.1 hypothetical protein M472_08095 [Sphingobacterium paucimobilis HER1398]